MKQIFSTAGKRLPLILKFNGVILTGLIVLAFFLPLSESERWFLVLTAAFLVGINWALLARARRND